MEKRIGIILIIAILSGEILSQSSLNHEDVLIFEKLEKDESIHSLIAQYQSKQTSDLRKLKKLFYTVKAKYLKKHIENSDFSSTLTNGEYDCVTGTLLFGYLLKKMGYEFHVHEFDFHTFLTVKVENKNVLFESTDDFGYIQSPDRILRRISFYTQNEKALNQKIMLNQAVGLYYFNQAAKNFNSRNFEQSRAWIEQASHVYPSERILGFKELLRTPRHLLASGD